MKDCVLREMIINEI